MSRRDNNGRRSSKIAVLAQIAVFTAVMCVLGPLSLPIGPVPISLGVLGVFLATYVLGMKKGLVATVIYILLGIVGLPVFAGFTGGVGKFAGPTGGYIYGYILMVLIAGFFIDRFYSKIWLQVIGMILALAALYIVGTIHLSALLHITFVAGLSIGVIPFIALDIAKIVVSVILGRLIRNRLIRAGIIRNPSPRA